MTSKVRKTKLEHKAQRALKLVERFAKEGCPRLRRDAGNRPIPTCLEDGSVIVPCYACRSVRVLSQGKDKA